MNYKLLNKLLGAKTSKLIKTNKYVKITRGSDDYGDFIKVETESDDLKTLRVETFYEKDFVTVREIDNYLRKG